MRYDADRSRSATAEGTPDATASTTSSDLLSGRATTGSAVILSSAADATDAITAPVLSTVLTTETPYASSPSGMRRFIWQGMECHPH